MRVLRWIIDRCRGAVGARETAIGNLPGEADLDIRGLSLAPAALTELLDVNPALWRSELAAVGEYLAEFGDRVPKALSDELAAVLDRVHSSQE
jgi:phosphoenolpyruvate carboxykinase (GTP)